MDAYLGVDISGGKWAGVMLGDRRDVAVVGDDIASLVAAASEVELPRVVAIDIPIRPPARGVRAADRAARAVLKGRGSTLFNTPAMAALEVARRFEFRVSGYPAALEANLEAQGTGLSRQAYALAQKILEVHDWLASGVGVEVIECHPEVSFAHLLSPRQPGPVPHGKKSWEGMRRRIKMLHAAGIDVQYIRDDTGCIGADDMVDAAAAAWTARRYAAGNAVRYPATLVDGDEAVIWA